ncbi:molecular chaperone DnaJ [Saprospira sp. CCB-QB6]|uniref:molecular chaperone DnaJ n=1 Tax=Saprospira sp. CCB-QB6 TaxID=3023936 RepID=UPI002349CD81|nr:molecular chaperone DnaJ [Saprospira sp. CCB-QB6]WCL82316.1 molecular chaperone DnaJ [Saprospira sp. CCB-QB6]
MAQKRDYYEVLGVDRNVDKAQLKKAYRKVAMKYHPDRNPDNPEAEEKFKEAAEAYEVLNDDQKRAAYDRYGHAGVNQGAGPGGAGGFSMEDIFSQFSDIFGGGGGGGFDFFGQQQGGRGRRAAGGQKGSNLRIRVGLTLEEIAKGAKKKIKVKKYVNCQSCGGSGAKDSSSIKTCSGCNGSGYVRKVQNTFLGQMQTTVACPQCNGSGKSITSKCTSCKGEGRTYGEETLELEIPAGVSEGMQLSMSGKGNSGMNGGPAGDLLINIQEKEHELFARDGNNIHYELDVNFADLVLGTAVEVPTLTGKVKVTLPAGTEGGKVFRLRGKGLPSLRGYGQGDQLIHVKVWVPQNISSEERRALEKMRDSKNFIPNAKEKGGRKGFLDRLRDVFGGN